MYKKKIEQYIEAHKQEMLDDICALCSINSERSAYQEGDPFGEGPSRALAQALKMAEEYGFSINNYFIRHPEMILGRQSAESTQYGKQDFTVEPLEGADLAAQLHEAVQHIGGIYQAAELPDLGEEDQIQDTIPADPDVKNYSYTLVAGEVYYRENSVMVKPVG